MFQIFGVPLPSKLSWLKPFKTMLKPLARLLPPTSPPSRKNWPSIWRECGREQLAGWKPRNLARFSVLRREGRNNPENLWLYSAISLTQYFPNDGQPAVSGATYVIRPNQPNSKIRSKRPGWNALASCQWSTDCGIIRTHEIRPNGPPIKPKRPRRKRPKAKTIVFIEVTDPWDL